MFHNLIKVLVRSLIKDRVVFAINFFGLSVGLATFLLLMLFVDYEMNYDLQHPHAENIYRIKGGILDDPSLTEMAVTPATFAPALKEAFPEVKNFMRIARLRSVVRNPENDVAFYEEDFTYADSTILTMFSFPLAVGDERTALVAPYSIVLTPSVAKKYFGSESPIGKVLRVANSFDFTVTGVLKDDPTQTHLKFNFLASFATLSSISKADAEKLAMALVLKLERKGFYSFYSYLQLEETADYQALNAKLPAFVESHVGQGRSKDIMPELKPMTEIHLGSNYRFEMTTNSSESTVYTFMTIALVVLLIACINYMNLSTARYTLRAREVAMRKVMGSGRGSIAIQFFAESLFVTCLSFLVAMVIARITLPMFNNLFQRQIPPSALVGNVMMVRIFILLLVTSAVSGLYPAIFLSGFKPLKVLKGRMTDDPGSVSFRKGLVVVQFVISIALVSGTFVVYQQMRFIRTKNLGYNPDRILYVPLRFLKAGVSQEIIRNEFSKVNGVVSTSISSDIVGRGSYLQSRVTPISEGNISPSEDHLAILNGGIDKTFLGTFEIELLQGRPLPDNLPDSVDMFIINEAAVKMFGGRNPIGLRLKVNNPLSSKPREGEVIGVFKDFNFASLHTQVEPLLFHKDPRTFSYVFFKISTQDVSGLLRELSGTWRSLFPDTPFDYVFLDDEFDRAYKEEQKLLSILNWFSILALLIGGLGLWGLSIFAIERRKKEVSIKKILGAPTGVLIFQQLKQYLYYIAVSSVIAIPIASYGLIKWLSSYAYKIDIEPWYFAASMLIVTVISICTILVQVMRAANANPTTVLRAE
ncbi:MAG TPA: ABC transporter permease [Cyclobacteriaceae bacterium]|nr:ABC transporter permease [Cyclobacteriaceae bacterium]